MKSRRNIFLVIALLYFLAKLLYVTLPGVKESIVNPGWHTTIEYKVVYLDWFAAVFFLAIAAIYQYAERLLPVILFRIHAALSVVPLFALAIWPFYFNNNSYDMESVLTEYRIMRLLELFFIISQGVFTIVLITKKGMINNVRTT